LQHLDGDLWAELCLLVKDHESIDEPVEDRAKRIAIELDGH
jgi:hypothetical protein